MKIAAMKIIVFNTRFLEVRWNGLLRDIKKRDLSLARINLADRRRYGLSFGGGN